MPAPDRIGDRQTLAKVLDVPKGIVGVYTDLEVDALLANIPGGGGGTVDLSAYATTAYVDGELAKVYDKAAVDAAIAAAIALIPAADLTNYYTKPEVDQKFVDAATGGTVDLAGYATTDQLDATKNEILTAATTAFQERYTKPEVDSLFVKKEDMVAPPSLDGYATEQYVDDSIARIPASDLSAYAKLNDTAQAVTAKTVTAEAVRAVGFQFIKENSTSTAFVLADVGGQERPVYAVGSKTFPIAFTSELTGGESADLSAYAKTVDNTQNIVANATVAKGYTFGDSLSPNNPGLVYADTGEGYGTRLILDTPTGKELIPYQSDFEPIKARMDALENKSAASTDLTGYATKTDLNAYCTIMDAATQLATKAAKADTYTKAEVDDIIARTPSPMKYLAWGGAFQKLPAGNAKDKWFAAGLLPSIQIVKGKHYRLEMTLKFGPFNTDVKEAWAGFRFNYRALNELPCTKQPLVTMSGWGTTTVTRARATIASNAVATTTPTRADRFRFNCVDDWTSAEDIIEYAVEFEADQDIANANFVPEVCFGGTWLTFPANFEGVVAVFRQMD